MEPENPNRRPGEEGESEENFYGVAPRDPGLRPRKPTEEELAAEAPPVIKEPLRPSQRRAQEEAIALDAHDERQPSGKLARPAEEASPLFLHRATPPVDPPSARRASTAAPDGSVFGALDLLAILFLSIFSSFAVVLTYGGFGHSWDEALYLKPSVSAVSWFSELLSGNKEILKRENIDAHWGRELTSTDPLHPEIAPIPKIVSGIGAKFIEAAHIDPVIAMRLPTAAFFGLTVALIYLLGRRGFGRLAGFSAAVFYLLMPRVFGHAHIAASETLLAFSVVFVVWAYLLAMEVTLASLLVAFAFAIAILTKVNALLLPLPLMIWGQIYKRNRYASSVFAMVFLSPLLVFALWPWLWQNGVLKFLQYLAFYAQHQSTSVFYLGRMWGYNHGGPAPWHYPFLITILSLPEWMLLFLTFGILRAIGQSWKRPVPVLFLLMAGLAFLVAALPGQPKYDGERLFFSAFPFIALLCGGGFAGLFFLIPQPKDATHQNRAYRNWIGGLVLLAFILLGIVDLAVSYPNHLNYYNWIAGRPKGALKRGFETSYWGEALNNEVIDELNRSVAPGQTVRPLALNALALTNLQAWNKLRRDIKISDVENPDWFVLQVRQGMMGRVERHLHESVTPYRTFYAQGVPRIQLFKITTSAAAPPVVDADVPANSAATLSAPAATPVPTAAATPAPVVTPQPTPVASTATPALSPSQVTTTAINITDSPPRRR